MKKLRKAALFALIVLYVMTMNVSCATVAEIGTPDDLLAAERNDTWFNLQNFHFLEWFYERDGYLVYGDIDFSAEKALWSFTRASRRQGLFYVYAVRNKASGRFLVPDPNSTRVLVTESEDPFRWSWWVGPWGIVLGDARANAFRDPSSDNIICIHMESRNGFAENSLINRTWGTPNWLLHYRGEERFWAIRSEGTGLYLYQDDYNNLRLGDGAEMDSRFHWVYENINNILSVRNRRTGHTISVEDIFNAGNPLLDLPVQVINSLQHWQTNRWVMARAGTDELFSIDSGFSDLANFRLQANPATNFVYLTNTMLPSNPAVQWRQVEVEGAALDVRIPDYWVRLRNSGVGEYVYEQQQTRTVIVGRPDRSDPRSHWLLVEDEEHSGYFRMRNRYSGRDIAPVDSPIVMMRTVDPDDAGDNALWALAFAQGNENLLFRNKANPTALFNVDRSGEKGFAEASVHAATAGHVQWMTARAPDAGAVPAARALTPSANRAAALEHLREIPAESVFRAGEALRRRNEVIFTVFAPQSGSFPVAIAHQPARRAIAGNIYVNGIRAAALPEQSNAQINLPMNVGINSISIRTSAVNRIESLTVRGGAGIARRGATVPFRQYEAEDMITNALILQDSRVYRQFASEASGRSAVKLLNTGDFVEFTTTAPTNSLVVRYSIPDAPGGGGIEATLGLYINGQRVRDLELTSKFAWVYGVYPWTNIPDDRPKRFFDDSRFLLDSTLPAGTVVRLQRGVQDTAEFYIIDFVETEYVPPPMSRPPNSVCITEFGAVPNDGQDDTEALMRAIRAAGSRREVWIPAGVFDFHNAHSFQITQNNLTIRGAGMWHSVLNGLGAGFMIRANGVSFYDFAIFGYETGRDDHYGRTAFENYWRTRSARDWTIQNIWMEHLKVGVWVYAMEGMLVAGTRIRNTFADGINITGGSNNNILEQNHIRNTGDDGIAAWSMAFLGRNNTNNRIRFNTVGLPWLASAIAIYGGQDNFVADNIIHDTASFGGGINISARHDPMPFRGAITVERNTLLRSGGNDYNFDQNLGAVWIAPLQNMDVRIVLRDNDIIDSSYQALLVLGNYHVREIIMENNHIDTVGTWGISISGNATGKMELRGNIISGNMLGPLRNSAGDGFVIQGDL